jgi:hypothetical protein
MAESYPADPRRNALFRSSVLRRSLNCLDVTPTVIFADHNA